MCKWTKKVINCSICCIVGRGSTDPSNKVVLVYFLGGCTHSEITALRFLGQQKSESFQPI